MNTAATVADLQTLPEETLLRDAHGSLVLIVKGQFRKAGPDLLWALSGVRCAVRHSSTWAASSFPFTVLHQGEES